MALSPVQEYAAQWLSVQEQRERIEAPVEQVKAMLAGTHPEMLRRLYPAWFGASQNGEAAEVKDVPAEEWDPQSPTGHTTVSELTPEEGMELMKQMSQGTITGAEVGEWQ